MTQHQNHHIAKDENGWHCQTCADQAATEAALRNEIARLIDENERLQRDNVTLLEKTGSAYFNVIGYGRKTTPSETAHTKGNA